jgi:hypothetical protein
MWSPTLNLAGLKSHLISRLRDSVLIPPKRRQSSVHHMRNRRNGDENVNGGMDVDVVTYGGCRWIETSPE